MTGRSVFCVLAGIWMVIAMMTATPAGAGADKGNSSISCRVEGGNVPVMATTMDFAAQGKAITLTLTREYWDKDRKSTVQTAKIAAEDYQRLWDYVEKQKLWELKDSVYMALDMPVYTFRFQKGTREKTVRGMNISELNDQRYYLFYSLLKTVEELYIKQAE